MPQQYLKNFSMESLKQMNDMLTEIYRRIRINEMSGNIKFLPGKGVVGGFAGVGASAYLDTNMLNLTDMTLYKVTINHIIWDLNGDFDTVNNRFVAPFDGYYLILAQIGWMDTVVDRRFEGYLRVNGGYKLYDTKQASEIASSLTNRLNTALYLAKDEYVEVWARHYGGNNTPDISAGEGRTRMVVLSWHKPEE